MVEPSAIEIIERLNHDLPVHRASRSATEHETRPENDYRKPIGNVLSTERTNQENEETVHSENQ
jgi:hypothetical protein